MKYSGRVTWTRHVLYTAWGGKGKPAVFPRVRISRTSKVNDDDHLIKKRSLFTLQAIVLSQAEDA